MARARVVWIVTWGSFPIGAFTVKYEMERFLEARLPMFRLRVWKVPDGGHGKAVLYLGEAA